MIRLFVYAALLYFCYRLIKGPVASLLRSILKPPTQEDDSSPVEAELIRDPQCGTYFLKQQGIEARIDGKTVYFCSKSCRDKFMHSG